MYIYILVHEKNNIMGSITLKELSAYLPYKIQGVADFLPDTIFIVNSISCTWVKGYTKEGNNVPLGCNIKKFKPLLRPLSDLTKEIEINGERFVPIDWFEKNVNKTISFFQAMNLNYSLNIDIETENYSQTIDLYNGYLVVQKLLEWHFDCFNLIDKGLAIDLNII